MKKLLELESKLIKAKEELSKSTSNTPHVFDKKTMVMTPHSDTHMTVHHGSKTSIMSDADAHAYSVKHGGPDQKKHGISLVNHARDTGMAFENQDATDGHPSDVDIKAARALNGKPMGANTQGHLSKSLLGDMNPVQKMDGQTGMPAGTADINVAKEDKIRGCEDKDKAKKIMEEEMDEHNEKKHGEDKDEDSAKKSDIPKSITDQSTDDIITDIEKPKPMETTKKGCNELVKFHPNGQWSLSKAVRQPTIGSPSSLENKPTVEGAAKDKKYQGGDPRHLDTKDSKTKHGNEREVGVQTVKKPAKSNKAFQNKDTGLTQIKRASKSKPKYKTSSFTSGSSNLREGTKLDEHERESTVEARTGKKVKWNS